MGSIILEHGVVGKVCAYLGIFAGCSQSFCIPHNNGSAHNVQLSVDIGDSFPIQIERGLQILKYKVHPAVIASHYARVYKYF